MVPRAIRNTCFSNTTEELLCPNTALVSTGHSSRAHPAPQELQDPPQLQTREKLWSRGQVSNFPAYFKRKPHESSQVPGEQQCKSSSKCTCLIILVPKCMLCIPLVLHHSTVHLNIIRDWYTTLKGFSFSSISMDASHTHMTHTRTPDEQSAIFFLFTYLLY